MTPRVAITLVFVVQVACAAVFLFEILSGLLGLRTRPISWQLYEGIQIAAGVGLVLGTGVSAYLLVRSLRRQAKVEASLRIASGAFMDVLEDRFDAWELTPAERDVALFSIKGLSLAEIAVLRETSAGTVKAQTNAIYRKAGVSGRPQLLSLFIEDLMEVGGAVGAGPRDQSAA